MVFCNVCDDLADGDCFLCTRLLILFPFTFLPLDSTETWNVWQALDSNCPKRQGKVCNAEFDIPSAETIDSFWRDTNSSIQCQLDGLPLASLWEEWTAVAQPLFVANVTAPHDTLFDAEDSATEFWNTLDQDIHAAYEPLWNWTLHVAMAANTCLAFLAFGIMWVISMPTRTPAQQGARRKRLEAPFCWYTRRTFVILFWLIVFLAWAFGLWFSIGTVLTTDVCGDGDSPNGLSLELMERWETSHPSSEPLLFRLAAFLRRNEGDCSSIRAQDELNTLQWLGLVDPTHRLATALQDLPPNIYFDICGTALWPLQNSVDRLNEQLCGFTGAIWTEATESAPCVSEETSWYPDYTDIMFNSVCDQGSKALIWVTATQALILIMIMMTWTFRDAFLPEPVTPHSSEGTSCCKRFGTCFLSWPPQVCLPEWRSGRSSNNRWYLSKNSSSYSHHSSTGSSSEDNGAS